MKLRGPFVLTASDLKVVKGNSYTPRKLVLATAYRLKCAEDVLGAYVCDPDNKTRKLRIKWLKSKGELCA